jgi:hypothetical protein
MIIDDGKELGNTYGGSDASGEGSSRSAQGELAETMETMMHSAPYGAQVLEAACRQQ